MSKKILKSDIEKVQKLQKDLGEAEEIIHDRITYIWNTIATVFGVKLDTWYFYGAEEGSVGEFRYDEDVMSVTVEFNKAKYSDFTQINEMLIITKEGGEWDFAYGEFPTAWLFEDFEDELCEGVLLYTQQKAAKKLKAEQKKLKAKKDKENMKILAAAAKKKLSKEELKALGVK